MSRKQAKSRPWNYSNVPVRLETKAKFAAVHDSTRLSLGDIADVAIEHYAKLRGIKVPHASNRDPMAVGT